MAAHKIDGDPPSPRVVFDVAIGSTHAGRLTVALHNSGLGVGAPGTCEKCGSPATSSGFGVSLLTYGRVLEIVEAAGPPSRYLSSPAQQNIPGAVIFGSIITSDRNQVSDDEDEKEWQDEHLGGRGTDAKGLVCMTSNALGNQCVFLRIHWGNADERTRRIIITHTSTPELRNECTVFGELVSGEAVLDRMAAVVRHHPHTQVSISNWGSGDSTPADPAITRLQAPETVEERGRLKRRRLSSPPRSPSPSRGHHRDSADRYQHHHRQHHRSSSSASSVSIPPPSSKRQDRRRSDAEIDHNLRGRRRQRSRSQTGSALLESEGELEDGVRHCRKRSRPPSRRQDATTDGSQGGEKVRRQRSLPNIYRERRDGKKVVEV